MSGPRVWVVNRSSSGSSSRRLMSWSNDRLFAVTTADAMPMSFATPSGKVLKRGLREEFAGGGVQARWTWPVSSPVEHPEAVTALALELRQQLAVNLAHAGGRDRLRRVDLLDLQAGLRGARPRARRDRRSAR